MEEKNELNDILIGETQSGGGKKLIIIGSAVLLLFFAIIAVMKMVNAGDSKPSALPIDTEKKVKSIPAASLPVADQKDSNSASATANSADEKLNEIVKKLQQDAKTAPAAAPSIPAPEAKSAAKSDARVEVPIKSQPSVAEQPKVVIKEHPSVEASKNKPAAPVVVANPPAPQKQKEQVKSAPADVKKTMHDATVAIKPKAVQKPKGDVNATKSVAKTEGGGDLYMQVGRFSSDKSFESLLPKIKAAGLNYVVKRDDQNRTRLLIGPYKTQQDRTNDAPKIKEKVEPKAFPVKG